MRQNATVLLPLLAGLLLALTGAPAARAQGDLALLREHAPRLHHDARDPDRATAVEALVDGPVRGEAVALRPRVTPLPDVAYGRVVRAEEATFLQYWLLYADNPQDRGIVRTGRHEGDWELVQVRLGADGRPAAATYAQHGWAARCGRTPTPGATRRPTRAAPGRARTALRRTPGRSTRLRRWRSRSSSRRSEGGAEKLGTCGIARQGDGCSADYDA